MRVSARGERYQVFDDVLAEDERFELWESFSAASLNLHASDSLGGELLDGPVHRGGTRYRPALEADDDVIARRIRGAGQESEHLLGKEGVTWLGFTITPWSYEAGATLGWHNDGAASDSYTVGAFVWYVHPEWDASWSGDLLIVDEPGAHVRDRLPGASINRQLLDAPSPISVMPRPNRLVVFMGDTYHSVRRVDQFAETHARSSLTGFFLNKDPRS